MRQSDIEHEHVSMHDHVESRDIEHVLYMTNIIN